MSFLPSRPIFLAHKNIIDQVLETDFGIKSERVIDVQVCYGKSTQREIRRRKYYVVISSEFDTKKVDVFIINAKKMKGEHLREADKEQVLSVIGFAAYLLKTS